MADPKNTKMLTSSEDLYGDRSSLRVFHEMVPLNFIYTLANNAWGPNLAVGSFLQLLSAGAGDAAGAHANWIGGNQTGTQQTITEDITTLLQGGFPSRDFYFTLCELGFQVMGPPVTVAALNGGKVDLAAAGTTLEVRRDTQALAALFWQAFMSHAHLEYLEAGRKCSTLLGPCDFHPAGIGLYDSSYAPANGFPVGQNTMRLRRALVMRPQNENGFADRMRLYLDHAGRVPFDNSFPEPAPNAQVSLVTRMTLRGYFSDADGTPVENAVEKQIADSIMQKC